MKKFVTIAVSLLAFAAFSCADVEHFRAKGAHQGNIVGAARGGWTLVRSFELSSESPTDPSSGQATGKRQHKPFVVRLDLDSAAAKYLEASFTNETLTDVWFNSQTANSGGASVQRFGIHMINARIVAAKIGGITRDAEAHAPSEVVDPYLELTIVYQRAEFTAGGSTTVDDWGGGSIG